MTGAQNSWGPKGEVLKSFSWEGGYDWEFEYRIEVYSNGVMFVAGGDAERGISNYSEFQSFADGVQKPHFMHTGGEYFLFERWMQENGKPLS